MLMLNMTTTSTGKREACCVIRCVYGSVVRRTLQDSLVSFDHEPGRFTLYSPVKENLCISSDLLCHKTKRREVRTELNVMR